MKCNIKKEEITYPTRKDIILLVLELAKNYIGYAAILMLFVLFLGNRLYGPLYVQAQDIFAQTFGIYVIMAFLVMWIAIKKTDMLSAISMILAIGGAIIGIFLYVGGCVLPFTAVMVLGVIVTVFQWWFLEWQTPD